MILMLSITVALQFCFVSCYHGDKNVIIDLSYSYDEETLFWPGSDRFVHTIVQRGPTGVFWYESNKFEMGEHSGTHIDAPSHFSEGKQRIHDIPNEHLFGPGIKVDITEKASINSDALLEVEDLKSWEEENGIIPNGAILMVFTDWGRFYPNRTAYFGSDRNDSFTDENGKSLLHFPGVSPEAANWLIINRDVVGVGIDTPSIDYGQSLTFSTHVKLYEQNIYGLENVANLDQLPTTGSTVYALPIKIKDGSGAPVRLFAVADDVGTNSATSMPFSFFIIFFLSIISLSFNHN
ncbi:isatin hydrolase-like [Antedon mediterranea]|uniref:isatin hydrolase-like n=1 Tax=Antedon mediterranea TaxID=105859 RepID=UPI003AF7DFAF